MANIQGRYKHGVRDPDADALWRVRHLVRDKTVSKSACTQLVLRVVNRAPAWTSTKYGLDIQKKVWNEMTEVWRGVAPEVADIVL